MQAAGNVPDQVFPHPDIGATRPSGVDLSTSDAQRPSGSSVSPARATGMVRQGRPMAAIRLSEPSTVSGTGQPGPEVKDRSDGWQMSNRSLFEGKMGQPVLLENREKLDVQPLELPIGKPGQPGRTDPEGRMDATASREDPRGKSEGNLLPPARIGPRSTIRRMDLDHREGRGNPILLM
jgi:hypothetical protein